MYQALILTLVLITAQAHADLRGVVEQLKQQTEQSQGSVVELQEESEQIANQMQSLHQRYQEIQDSINAITKKGQSQNLEFESFAEAMRLPIRGCAIESTEYEGEYIIQYNKDKIRFVLTPELVESSGKITMKKVGFDLVEVIEIEVKAFVSTVSPASEFKVVMRLKPETYEVIHATFVGQKVEDTLFGMGSSFEPAQISCIL